MDQEHHRKVAPGPEDGEMPPVLEMGLYDLQRKQGELWEIKDGSGLRILIALVLLVVVLVKVVWGLLHYHYMSLVGLLTLPILLWNAISRGITLHQGQRKVYRWWRFLPWQGGRSFPLDIITGVDIEFSDRFLMRDVGEYLRFIPVQEATKEELFNPPQQVVLGLPSGRTVVFYGKKAEAQPYAEKMEKFLKGEQVEDILPARRIRNYFGRSTSLNEPILFLSGVFIIGIL